MMDKKYLFQDKSHEEAVYVPDNLYSLGMEVEFKCGRGFATKYNNMVRGNCYGYSDSYESEMYSTLGFDGSGPSTKEFRSPVFISEDVEDCLSQLKIYTLEVEVYLLEEFKAKFAPYLGNNPLGVHFSLGGKFKKNKYKDYIKRSKIIQPKLENMVSGKDKDLFLKRERHYPGTIASFLTEVDPFNYYSNYLGCNAIRSNEYRLEFRYLPSAKIESLFPIIEFVILDTSEPINNKLEFIK